MKWSTNGAVYSFRIQGGCDGQCIGVQLRHHVQGRVDLVNSSNIGLCLVSNRHKMHEGRSYVDKINASGEQSGFQTSSQVFCRRIDQRWKRLAIDGGTAVRA